MTRHDEILEAVNKSLIETGELPKVIQVSGITVKLHPVNTWENSDSRSYHSITTRYSIRLKARVSTQGDIIKIGKVRASKGATTGIAMAEY